MLETYETLIQGLLDKGFASVDTWFAEDELVCLRKSLLQHYENKDFHLAGIGNKETLQTVMSIRNDQVYWIDPEIANTCEKTFLKKMNDFVLYLNRTCYAGIATFEFHYAVYEKGSFFLKHIDRFKNDHRRKFSVACYITESWNPGDGGELLMYANDTVTTIEPLPGRMVFFDSELPHEVPVSQKQRLSLTGWMKTN